MGEYIEDDLIFIKVSENFLKGWALTVDSICINNDENFKGVNLYSDINNVFVNYGGSHLNIGNVSVDDDDDFLSKDDIIGIEKYLKHVKAILPR